MPLSHIIVKLPADGFPSLDDWQTCLLSFLFSGSRLLREPLDLNLDIRPDALDPDNLKPYLTIKKGFTRLRLGKMV